GLPSRRVAYVLLDFRMVTGADSSAIVSLTKLRNFCSKQDITLMYCSLSPSVQTAAEINGLFGGKSAHKALPDLNLALAWCEDRMLVNAMLLVAESVTMFYDWILVTFSLYVSHTT